jgi:hypothetical protein
MAQQISENQKKVDRIVVLQFVHKIYGHLPENKFKEIFDEYKDLDITDEKLYERIKNEMYDNMIEINEGKYDIERDDKGEFVKDEKGKYVGKDILKGTVRKDKEEKSNAEKDLNFSDELIYGLALSLCNCDDEDVSKDPALDIKVNECKKIVRGVIAAKAVDTFAMEMDTKQNDRKTRGDTARAKLVNKLLGAKNKPLFHAAGKFEKWCETNKITDNRLKELGFGETKLKDKENPVIQATNAQRNVFLTVNGGLISFLPHVDVRDNAREPKIHKIEEWTQEKYEEELRTTNFTEHEKEFMKRVREGKAVEDKNKALMNEPADKSEIQELDAERARIGDKNNADVLLEKHREAKAKGGGGEVMDEKSPFPERAYFKLWHMLSQVIKSLWASRQTGFIPYYYLQNSNKVTKDFKKSVFTELVEFEQDWWQANGQNVQQDYAKYDAEVAKYKEAKTAYQKECAEYKKARTAYERECAEAVASGKKPKGQKPEPPKGQEPKEPKKPHLYRECPFRISHPFGLTKVRVLPEVIDEMQYLKDRNCYPPVLEKEEKQAESAEPEPEFNFEPQQEEEQEQQQEQKPQRNSIFMNDTDYLEQFQDETTVSNPAQQPASPAKNTAPQQTQKPSYNSQNKGGIDDKIGTLAKTTEGKQIQEMINAYKDEMKKLGARIQGIKATGKGDAETQKEIAQVEQEYQELQAGIKQMEEELKKAEAREIDDLQK